MSSKSHVEIHDQEARKLHSRFEYLSDEAVSLRIVEKFLSEVEKVTLRAAPQLFPIDTVKESLQILKNVSSDDGISQDVIDAEFRLTQELRLWRSLLETKDRGIETFHLRRFCDSIKTDLNADILLAVARFYVNLPESPEGQSKFDLFITRAFERYVVNTDRGPRLARTEVAARVGRIYDKWGVKIARSRDDGGDAASAASRFDEFTNEAQNLSAFEDLIESNLFERIRSFKRELGGLFYDPAVVSSAIECNLAVGNVFRILLARANEDLSERLSSQFDFAGAFLDSSSDPRAHIAEALSELNIIDFSSIGSRKNDELAFLRDLLQLAVNETEPASVAEADPVELSDSTSAGGEFLTVRQRLAPILCTLAEPQPDIKMLRGHMETSDSLSALDLNDFLYSADKMADQLGRKAIAIIICLEELLARDLKGHKTLNPETRDELMGFLEMAEELSGELAIPEGIADHRERSRLLTVSNKLLETRLKLERSIVRFSSQNAANAEPEPAVEDETEVATIVYADGQGPKTSRWLIAATVFVTFICGSILLFSGADNSAAPLNEDAEEWVVSRLPLAEHLEVAFRQNTTLFVTAKASWETLPEADRVKHLQELLMLKAKKPLQTVIVIDGNGRPLGDISRNGLNILNEPPISSDDK